MDLINILVIVLGIGYIVYVVIDSFNIRKYRSNIKFVIHVNGIRGKSTITRLIDSGLRECGYKVMSKTTGTIPTIININNEEEKVFRHGPANIREQARLLKRASKENVDILVVECMAVNKELQKVSEENILKANLTVISNVREDHIGQMGEDKEELAKALATTTPSNGYLVTLEHDYIDIFEKKCRKKHSQLCIAREYEGEDLDTFEDNIAIALEVARVLSLDEKVFFEGMRKYKHDVGALSLLKYNNSTLINGFSINDIDSIKIVYNKLKSKGNIDDDVTILFSNREDRASRVDSLIRLFKDIKCSKVILAGSNIEYVERKLNKLYPGLPVYRLKNIEDLLKESNIFAIGNIGGIGLKILEMYKKGSGEIC